MLKRIWELVRPHKLRFWVALVTLVIASGASLVYPMAAKYAIDVGMSSKSTARLDSIIWALLGVFVLHAGFVWLRHYTMSWLGDRVVADLRIMVYERILQLPLAWFHERRTGELVGRLSADATVIEGVVGSELSLALRNAIQLTGGLVLLFATNWKLSLMMLAVVPPLSVGAVWFGSKIHRLSRDINDELAQVSGQAQEVMGAMQTVQAFGREDAERIRYNAGVGRVFAKQIQLIKKRSWFFSTTMMTGYVAIAGMIWLGGRALIAGEMTAGQLTSFFLYTFMVAGGFAELAGLWGSLKRAAGASERLFDIIDTQPSIASPSPAHALPDGGGHIAFDHVTFRYPSRPETDVLGDISFEVKPGQAIALVGASGGGKSTVLQLLFRFFDVTSGRITFEGVDIRELELPALRRALALVAQEPVLFSGTIADNICYGVEAVAGLPSAELRAAMETAARDANAHDFIMGFPGGYDTVVGERGVKLSGGQKQRIALARALLLNPRVLVLDEATSNLDAESEAVVQAAISRVMRGRTTIIVAHRLSTIRDADVILVMEGGRLVERGTHSGLMAQNGVYKRLVERQAAI